MQAQACSIKVEIIDQSDVTKLKGVIAGPPDTPFEGEIWTPTQPGTLFCLCDWVEGREGRKCEGRGVEEEERRWEDQESCLYYGSRTTLKHFASESYELSKSLTASCSSCAFGAVDSGYPL